MLVVHHLPHRVHQRPEIRVDLGLEVAWQVPEAFTRLDGRPHQHDLPHLLAPQGRHRQSHGQEGLAAAGRAGAEHDVVLADRLHVGRLPRGAGHKLAAGPLHLDRLVPWSGFVAGGNRQQAGKFVWLDAPRVSREPLEFFEHLGGSGDSLVVSLDMDRISAG